MRALFHARSGFLDAALAGFERALELQPLCVDALVAGAAVKSSLEDRDGAVEDLDLARRLVRERDAPLAWDTAMPAPCGADGCDAVLLPGKRSKCPQCRRVFYCSRACQVADWKAGHKRECSRCAMS